MRDGSGVWVFLRTKNHLRDPVTVAEIDEYHTAVITAGINPAAKNGRRPRIRSAQSTALYGPISHKLKN